MANNKLLGTLVLDSGKVLETINKVNAALKDLGKGVDLNLTNILNTKVNSQLQELKRQIDEVNRAATGTSGGRGSTRNAQLKEINSLLTQQYNAQLKLAQLENRQTVNRPQIDRQQSLLREAQERLAVLDQEKVAQQNALERFQNYRKRIDDARADSVNRGIQMEQKATQEQQKIQDQYDKESLKRHQQNREQEAKITLDSIQQRAKAQEEADRLAAENAKKLQDYRNKWRDYAVSAVGAISIAVLKEQWTAAINYATQYYDA